jgi:hypothetical protein
VVSGKVKRCSVISVLGIYIDFVFQQCSNSVDIKLFDRSMQWRISHSIK